MSPPAAHTAAAVEALRAGLRAEPDFATWLAQVLARLAAAEGTTAGLTAGRPGSWESGLVLELVRGTVGYDDEDLDAYRE